MKRRSGFLTCLVGAMCLLVALKAWAEEKDASNSEHFHHLNQRFLAPDLNIEKYIKKFEGEDRDVYRSRAAIMDALAVTPGMKIADIGAGTGLFTRLFASKVDNAGWVYAVDISPGFIDHIAGLIKKEKLANVSPVLSIADSVCLPPDSIDLAFVCDTYHHVESTSPFLQSIHRALRPGGALVIVEFNPDAMLKNKWLKNHLRKTRQMLVEEVEAEGFALVDGETVEALKDNYFVRFKKKAL